MSALPNQRLFTSLKSGGKTISVKMSASVILTSITAAKEKYPHSPLIFVIFIKPLPPFPYISRTNPGNLWKTI